MTDNFEILKDYITLLDTEFDGNDDIYYVVELIRRGKDNPNMPAANLHFKNYYINKESDLDKYKDEIIKLCELFNMRAYFSVNYKSYKQVLEDCVAEGARRVANHDYKRPYAIYESCSGKFVANGNKRWVVDVDKEDAEMCNLSLNQLTGTYIKFIRQCKPNLNIILTLNTKSGKHIICRPFDISEFNRLCIENNITPHDEHKHQIIKKNHITLLYEKIC